MRILLGEISSYKAIVIAEFIKKNYPKHILITYDYLKFTKTVRTKYSEEHIYIKKADDDSYISLLGGICNEKKIDCFIPVHSEIIGKILENRSLFNNALDYLGNVNDYELLHNKIKLSKIAKDIGIDIPIKFESIKEASVPFIIKPPDQSSSKGVRYIFNENKKNALKINNEKDIIIQEYVNGEGCGYSVYVKDGVILKNYGHRRLAEFPVSGGSSVYRTTFDDARMKKIAEQIFSKIKWTGFAMLEFKHTQDNKLVLIEINPRIWGSINQGLQCGVNFFEPILGRSIKNIQQRDKNTFLSPQLYLSFMRYALKGNFYAFSQFLFGLKKNHTDVSLIKDPKGFYSIILRRFFK